MNKLSTSMFLTPLLVISFVLFGMVRLKEIRKPGPTGDCDWVYEIAS